MKHNKKFLVFGSGAVGGYYGGMLVRAGYDVTFIARGENYKVLKEKGLTLIRENEKENFSINAIDNLKDESTCSHLSKMFDYILICVKCKDTKSAAESIKPIIGNNTTVVSFQNGVENEDIIADVIGKEYVLGGLVFVASRLLKAGVVDQFGYNGAMIGELYKATSLKSAIPATSSRVLRRFSPSAPACAVKEVALKLLALIPRGKPRGFSLRNYKNKITERVLELQKILTVSGIDCKISENMRGELWNKLVWNASFNPVSVITGKTVDEILKDKKTFELIKNIMTEVKDVAIANGYKIRPDTVEFNLGRSKGFEGFKTSMLQDFERGKPIEIEEMLGVVIRKAKEVNVKVPNAQKVYDELKCIFIHHF